MSLIGGVVKSSTQRSGSRKPPRGVMAAGFVLLALAVVALWPSLVASYSPLETDASSTLQPPSAEHIFGTDQSGRDVFSRVVHGAQYSLAIGLGATGVALGLGLLLGVSAALGSRIVDGILSRFIDVLMAFPEFLLALVVIAMMGPGENSIPLAVAIAATPAYARVARAETLVVAHAGYVRASASLGVSRARIILFHIIPNISGPLLVMATIGVGTAIVTAAGLSFLGLGAQPPTPEWGIILSEGRNFLATAWWIAVFPGLAITTSVVSISVVGRYFRTRREVVL